MQRMDADRFCLRFSQRFGLSEKFETFQQQPVKQTDSGHVEQLPAKVTALVAGPVATHPHHYFPQPPAEHGGHGVHQTQAA